MVAVVVAVVVVVVVAEVAVRLSVTTQIAPNAGITISPARHPKPIAVAPPTASGAAMLAKLDQALARVITDTERRG